MGYILGVLRLFYTTDGKGGFTLVLFLLGDLIRLISSGVLYSNVGLSLVEGLLAESALEKYFASLLFGLDLYIVRFSSLFIMGESVLLMEY